MDVVGRVQSIGNEFQIKDVQEELIAEGYGNIAGDLERAKLMLEYRGSNGLNEALNDIVERFEDGFYQ